jgi:hypothetical protein
MDHVEIIAGEPVAVPVPTDSGGPHDIYRCPHCATALWSDYGRRAGMRFVRVGTLEEPSAIRPDVHIFTRSKVPWIALPEGAPAFENYYDTKTLWPPQSLERRRLALAR